MPKKASVKYRSLRSNLVHLPLSLYASLAQQQARPQRIILHLSPLISPSSSTRQPQAAYLGWSGLSAASSLANVGLVSGGGGGGGLETVEVDPEVAMSLGWAEGTIVEIGIIHNPIKAKSVSVTPLTSDDWEILEQHANYLEEHLLSQLRAAKKGMILDVWVMGRTKIRIRVDETNPPTGQNAAVLLNSDTEIYVAPRPRGAKSNGIASETAQVIDNGSTSGEPSMGKGKGRSKEKSVGLRLVPQRVAAKWGQPDLSEVRDLGGTLAFCDSTTVRLVIRKLDGKEDGRPLCVRMRLDASKVGNGVPPGGGGSEKKKEDEEDVQDVWMVAWEEMPEGCVVLMGKVDDIWQSWGSVRVSLAGKKGRQKGKIPPDSSLTATSVPEPLPGMQDLLETIHGHFSRSFVAGLSSPMLLTGGKGSGKTTLAHLVGEAVANDRDILAETVYIDVARLDGEARLKDTKEKMDAWITDATQRRPCLLILDGLDTLLSAENELTPSQNPSILADHFARLFSAASLPPGILVLATASSTSALHPLLSSKHVFGETVKVSTPTKEIRREIIRHLLEKQRSALPDSRKIIANGYHRHTELDYVTLASITEGYSPSDLVDLVAGAMQQTLIRSAQDSLRELPSEQIEPGMEDFTLAQAAFTPISLRGVSLQKSEVKWSDIGGLHEPKRVLRETLEWPTKYAKIFASCPLRLRSGLLLYGYPGSGKTLLASAVAKECNLNFISVKGPEILNKYIGASEKAVRDLFERASGARPCVLFFDEFDSIAPRRGHDSTGVTDRVVNQLLTEMDGAQGLEGVYVLGATSRPDLIDPALLRPGRLDKSLLCDMPSRQNRMEILQAVSAKLTFAPSVDLDDIAFQTEGYSGADLQAMVYNAHLDVVHASISESDLVISSSESKGKGKGKGKGKANGVTEVKLPYTQIAPLEEKGGSAAERSAMASRIETIVAASQSAGKDGSDAKKPIAKPVIEHHHLLRSLETTRPSVSPTDRARLSRIYKRFVAEREGGLGNGEMGRETGTRASLM